jgi:predicted acylesterase/phospholipase RssA
MRSPQAASIDAIELVGRRSDFEHMMPRDHQDVSRRRGRRARVAAIAACVTFVTGCAAIHRPPTTRTALQAATADARALQTATVAALVDGLACRAAAREDHVVDILLLSGGGQNGAYGAGFLRGWQSRPDGPMPRFDLVTGVSAGALQAPYALIGTAESVGRTAFLFRNAVKSFAPTLDWWFWLWHTGGVANVKRLRDTVTSEFNADFEKQLHREFAADKHLVIATTDFDLGVGHAWDIGHELGGTEAGLPRARQILMASSAIPGVFPPVVIDGHVHADGGVASNVYVPLGLDDYKAFMTRARADGVSGDITVRIWVVMNLWADPTVNVTDPSDRGAMHGRAGTLLFMSQQPEVITRLSELAAAVSSGIPGLRMEVRTTAIPTAMADEPGARKLFDDAWMRRLEQFGYDRARGANPWDIVIPAPARQPR